MILCQMDVEFERRLSHCGFAVLSAHSHVSRYDPSTPTEYENNQRYRIVPMLRSAVRNRS